MISFPEHLPLLEVGRIGLIDYEERWLAESIKKAAEKAGHDKWWFAEHIARGVIEYLRQRFDRNTITLDELFQKIERTLQSIGFKDIAAELRAEPPPLRISLAELACEADQGYELSFLTLITQRIAEARRLSAAEINFSGLRQAVQLLLKSSRWDQRSRDLRDLIVTLVRSHVAASGGEDIRVVIR